LTDAFSLYANGSLNRATTKSTGLEIAGVPDNTSALGVLYRSGGWAATLFYKRVGRTFALDNEGFSLSAYSTTDLNVSYKFANPGAGFKSLKLQLGIFNLFDKESVIAATPTNRTAGTANYGLPTPTDVFQWQPSRSMMATLRAEY
jgi:iron complex outermembrane receptor protein